MYLWDLLRDRGCRLGGCFCLGMAAVFSSSLAYHALFLCMSHLAGGDKIWKIQAQGKCRFFGWLVLHGHCWTSNIMHRHGLRDRDDFSFWAQEVETLDHLFIGCAFNHETWFCNYRFVCLQELTPQNDQPFCDWWLRSKKQVPKDHRKGFDSLALLVIWSLWKERNRQVHDRTVLQSVVFVPVSAIKS